MLNPPLSAVGYYMFIVPLGTLYLQCRWVLYVFSAVEHYHFVTAAGLFFSTLDRRYPYPVGGQWAALTTNYYVVVVVIALATTQWRRAPSSPQFNKLTEPLVK